MPSAAERRDRLVADAARHDVVEVRQVGIDVEGEAVHRAAAAQAHADGRDLRGPVDPHARVAVEPGRTGEPEVGQRVDQHLLDRAHVGDGVGHAAAPLAGHRQDRVADELARPVVGDVAAAVGADQLGADASGVDQHVGRDRPRTPSV